VEKSDCQKSIVFNRRIFVLTLFLNFLRFFLSIEEIITTLTKEKINTNNEKGSKTGQPT